MFSVHVVANLVGFFEVLQFSTKLAILVKNMALVESEVAFQRRCDELEPGLYAKCKGQDIVSFRHFSFCIGFATEPSQ